MTDARASASRDRPGKRPAAAGPEPVVPASKYQGMRTNGLAEGMLQPLVEGKIGQRRHTILIPQKGQGAKLRRMYHRPQ